MGRSRSFLRAGVGLVIALAAAGCRSRPDAPVKDRTVYDPAPVVTRGEPKQPPEWFEAEYDAIRELADKGELFEAVKRVYEVRDQRPSEDWRKRFDLLLTELNQAVLEVQTLVARVVPEADPVVFGEHLRVRVVFTAPGPRPVFVPANRAGVGPSVLVLDIERTDRDARAQVVTTRVRRIEPLPRNLEVPAHGTYEIQLDLGTVGNDRPLDGFRTYTVGGLLRPTLIDVGGLRRFEAVPLTPGVLRSFRENYEHLEDDPVARIAEAVAKNAPVHLITAAALVPPERLTEAVDRLVALLRGDRVIDLALYAALQYLTGIELGRDAGAWRAWWPRVRATWFQGVVPEPGEGTGKAEPRFETPDEGADRGAGR